MLKHIFYDIVAFLGLLITFCFPLACIVMPGILAVVFSNGWLTLLYVITVPAALGFFDFLDYLDKGDGV